jgi:hypothetical protein
MHSPHTSKWRSCLISEIQGQLFFSSSLLPLLEHRAEFPQFLDQGQSVGLLGRVITSQGLYLYTNRKTHTHTQTLNINALSGMRTHSPGFWASGDSARLRTLGYRDRHRDNFTLPFLTILNSAVFIISWLFMSKALYIAIEVWDLLLKL